MFTRFGLTIIGLFSWLGFGVAHAAPAAQARITAVKIYDEGSVDASSSSIAVDTDDTTCSGGDEEPFTDTLLGLTIKNNYLSALKIERFWYVIPNYDGLGNSFTSDKLAPAGSFEIAAKTSADILVAFIHAQDGSKYFTGASTAIASTLGFRNVNLKVRARTRAGRVVNFSAKTVMSFGEVNRCPS